MTSRILGVALAVLAVAGSQAMAQTVSENQVAVMTDWSVFEEPDPKECWAVSQPKETVNTRNGQVVSVRRSEIRLMAFFRPGAELAGQVAFTGGYPFADGSTVSMAVDNKTFELYTQGEWAWPANAGDDASILAALKAGTDAVLTARSGRGTVTKDTFSLMGFTAAVEDSASRCK
ncbi:invasion associated locus B family protein [Pseudooceanicola algae]|uniref:Invasion associated locus B (IalB) protein n=1 Tax=Pseudooceanicola algae TaxID=1537215 RepID=A0A418SGJ4_9RHOB|nr:invasion associated locus B family protein [Pseudooceanicola algae]QPM91651.1 hypothetical protein PSAL_029060 [Pseudooceanicola algae]